MNICEFRVGSSRKISNHFTSAINHKSKTLGFMFGLRSKCPRIAWSAEQASWLETLRRDKEINKAAVIQKLLQPFQPFHAMAVGHRSINLKWLKRKAFRMENDPGGFTRWLVAYISLVHGPYKPTNTTGGWAPLCRFGFQNPTWN